MHAANRTGNSRKRPIHATPPLQAREIWLIVAVSACLLWTTWTLGGVRLWAQCGSTALALASLALAIWPSRQRGWESARALVRFLPFWLGLFLAVYMVVQYLNAAWAFEPGPDGRLQAVKLDSIGWLPAGVDTPWRIMNPLRMLLIFAPCWLVTCTLWCGSYRPKAMRALMWVQVLNSSAFAVLGILQVMTHASKVLWLFEGPIRDTTFWGMIANPNHASAFMNLGLTAALALFLYYTGRQGRDFTKGGAFLMLVPLAVLIVAGILQAMSRAGIVVAALIVLSFVAVLVWRLIRMLREEGNRTLVAISCAMMLLVVVVSASIMRSTVDAKMLERELRSMIAVADSPESNTRYFINLASMDLFERRPVYGWGAGCYRYFINITQKNYPELKNKTRPYRLVFAHNDYMNCLCDLGIVGSAPLFTGVLSLPVFVIFFRRKGIDGAVAMGLLGIGAVMLHISLEFFMQHPLVALQFAILLGAVTRIACLRHHQRLRAIAEERTLAQVRYPA